jgi:hypothetical protein
VCRFTSRWYRAEHELSRLTRAGRILPYPEMQIRILLLFQDMHSCSNSGTNRITCQLPSIIDPPLMGL